MQHYNILIATPGSNLEAEYVKSLTATLIECEARGLTYKWLNSQGSDIQNVRESTLSDNKLNIYDKGPMNDKVDYDKVFWIDSDISWTVDDFFRLYDSDKDVITGAYLTSDGYTTTVHGLDGGQYIPKDKILKMQEVIRIQSCGFGFIAMKKGVFERIKRPWFELMPTEIAPGYKILLSEDVSWCVKAMMANIPIHFDPKVLLGHMKKQLIKWK
jgi:hypothetical protein